MGLAKPQKSISFFHFRGYFDFRDLDAQSLVQIFVDNLNPALFVSLLQLGPTISAHP